MSERERAKKSITEKIGSIENDNVIRSMCFVMGDYMVNEDGEERANYIAATLLSIVSCENIENLSKIYSVAKAFAEIEAEKTV